VEPTDETSTVREEGDDPEAGMWKALALLSPNGNSHVLDLLSDGPPGCTALDKADTTGTIASMYEAIWCGNVRSYGAERLATTALRHLAPGGRLIMRGWSVPQPTYYIPYRLGDPPGLMDRVNAALRAEASSAAGLAEGTFWETQTVLGFLEQTLRFRDCRLITSPVILHHPVSAMSRPWLQEEWNRVRTDHAVLSHLSATDREHYWNLTDPSHAEYLLCRPDFLYLRYNTVAVGIRPPA
jgi:hypothetical protein